MYLVLVLHLGADELPEQIISVDWILLPRVTCIGRLEVAARLAGRLTHAMIPGPRTPGYFPVLLYLMEGALQYSTPQYGSYSAESKAKMNHPCHCITLGAIV